MLSDREVNRLLVLESKEKRPLRRVSFSFSLEAPAAVQLFDDRQLVEIPDVVDDYGNAWFFWDLAIAGQLPEEHTELQGTDRFILEHTGFGERLNEYSFARRSHIGSLDDFM